MPNRSWNVGWHVFPTPVAGSRDPKVNRWLQLEWGRHVYADAKTCHPSIQPIQHRCGTTFNEEYYETEANHVVWGNLTQPAAENHRADRYNTEVLKRNLQKKRLRAARPLSMPDFVTVARVGEIPPGEGRAFEADGVIVAVFNIDGEYWAIDDFCPHQGASLAAGSLAGTCVTCYLHGWRFDVTDGTWLDNPTSKLKAETFPTRVVDDEIQVDVG